MMVSIVFKLTIPVTKGLSICVDTIQIIYHELIFP